MELKLNKQAFLIYSAEADVALTLNKLGRKEFILNYSTRKIHWRKNLKGQKQIAKKQD